MLGMQTDAVSSILWFIFFIFFMLFSQRIMLTQAVLKLEKDVVKFEEYAEKSRKQIENSVKSNIRKKKVKKYMDFFAINPIDADPFGVIKRMDHIVKNSEDRLIYFANQIVPEFSDDKKDDMKMALIAGITTNQIAKIVRDFLEKIKKYKMYQLAIILQMQMPMIEEMAKSSMNAVDAFLKQMPIGDTVGPLFAAKLMKGKAKVDNETKFAYYKTKLFGRNVLVCKASGPGGNIGQPGKFLEKISKGYNKIITVDAAGKMEGEKSGSVAEGVGVAMGGTVEKYQIEEVAVKKNLPLDAIAIKMNNEEALSPMTNDILNAIPDAMILLEESIGRAKKTDKIIIVGVGNTSGVGNESKMTIEAEKKIKAYNKKKKKEAEENKGFFKKIKFK